MKWSIEFLKIWKFKMIFFVGNLKNRSIKTFELSMKIWRGRSETEVPFSPYNLTIFPSILALSFEFLNFSLTCQVFFKLICNITIWYFFHLKTRFAYFDIKIWFRLKILLMKKQLFKVKISKYTFIHIRGLIRNQSN